MKNRTAFYQPDEYSYYDRKILLTAAGREKKIACFSKDKFNSEESGRVIGYIHQNNRQYTGKEYATLKGLFRANIDIYSKKKFDESIVGYIETTEGEYLAITQSHFGLIVIIAAVILALILVLGSAAFYLNAKKTKSDESAGNTGVLAPVSEIPVAEEQEQTEPVTENVLYARIALPEGGVDFSGEIDDAADEAARLNDPSYKGNPYNGNVTAKVTMIVDETEHVILESQELNVSDGALASTALDFTGLDFEVTPGVYKGTANLIYADGSEVVKDMDITVVSAVSGTLGISYSDQASVDRQNSTISMSYTPDNSPNDSFIQIIIVSNGEEYILGQSGLIKNNETVESIPLDENMKDKLQTGVYDGLMRVYIASEESEDTVADIHTDIEISITVQ